MVSVIAAVLVAAAVTVLMPTCSGATRRLDATTASIEAPGWWLALVRRPAARAAASGRAGEAASVVRVVASELRAGATTAAAFAAAAVEARWWHADLGAAALAMGRGADAASELRRLAGVGGGELLGPLAAVVRAGAETGAPLAGVLDRLADAAEARTALREQLRAELAGARASAWLLAGLPLAGLAMGQALGASPLHLLMHRPLGWVLMAVATILDGIGLVWVRRLSRAC